MKPLGAGVLLAAVVLGAPVRSDAQAVDSVPRLRPDSAVVEAVAEHPYAHQAFETHPHGTVVAVALRLPVGTQHDPEGLEGSATLLARALEDAAGRALDPSLAALAALVDRSSTTFTLVALPDAWRQAWERVDSVLFEAALDPEIVAERRRELEERLAFESGSPGRDYEREAAAFLVDPGDPWARPPEGTPTSVSRITAAGLSGLRAARYRRLDAAQAVVGPVAAPQAPASAADTLPGLRLVPDSLPADSARKLEPAAAAGGAAGDTAALADTVAVADTLPAPARVAWATGSRVSLVRDVTSTWMAVAYPVPTDLPRTHLELLAHLLLEELDPVPPDPDRYDVDVRVQETPGGPVLLVEATVFPEAAERWEERILGAVTRLRGDAMGDDFFRWRRRRFRTARLLRETAPEVEAARITADLLRSGEPRALGVEVWALDADALRDAARALGEPRVLRFGPDLGQDGSTGEGAARGLGGPPEDP